MYSAYKTQIFSFRVKAIHKQSTGNVTALHQKWYQSVTKRWFENISFSILVVVVPFSFSLCVFVPIDFFFSWIVFFTTNQYKSHEFLLNRTINVSSAFVCCLFFWHCQLAASPVSVYICEWRWRKQQQSPISYRQFRKKNQFVLQ